MWHRPFWGRRGSDTCRRCGPCPGLLNSFGRSHMGEACSSVARDVATTHSRLVSLLEPVAIVGIGCRLPGGIASPNDLLAFLRARRDGVVDIPADRWSAELFYDPNPDAPGKAYVRRGSFLRQNVFDFDPAPFGISPREADRLDPQQRLLLEVTWEALEDASTPIERIRGSNTGVF